ncbi:MAG: M20/M25/M40 family metallo-hydrolase [Pseudomonadota bacterium]|nr:M20/M25/M40 family metallo-hydrolase [Pseudomonadota bacterium]
MLARTLVALSLALALSPGAAAAPGAARGPAPAEAPLPTLPVDWAAAGDETARLLSEYIRVDTTNPPGNEQRGADFLAARLAAVGIPSVQIQHAPGRTSLVGRIDGADLEPPLCLLSHIDVASAEPERWPEGKGPLSGTIEDGVVWGRGALDMKGLGAVQTMTMIELARLGVPLRRDVILLAVADEEVDNTGMIEIAEKHWSSIGCSQVINEGGLGIKDLLFEGQTVFGISVAEKGLLWVRMVATGPAGHGSNPNPESAPARLGRAVEALEAYEPKPKMHGALRELFWNVGGTRKGLYRYALRHPRLIFGRLLAQNAGRALLTDTINVTGFNGGLAPNVVPSEVSANLDCRLLPGTTPAAMLARLRELVPDPLVRFDVIQQAEANESPTDDPFYRALARHVVAGRTDAVAGPALSIGFTDSLVLRPLGVHAYGLAPFEVTVAQAETQHGHGEHVSVENLRNGLRVLLGAVVEVAATDPANPMAGAKPWVAGASAVVPAP